MTQIFKSELTRKNTYIFLLFYIMFIPVILTVWSSFLGVGVAGGNSYEEFIIISGFTATTYYYQKYKREDYLKISYLSGLNKNIVKFYLFLFLFILLFVLSYIFIFVVYLMTYLDVLKMIGFTGYEQTLPTFLEMNWLFFTYCIIMYILFIVGIAYILNHFCKSMSFIFGFIIIISFINLRFSLTIHSPLEISPDNYFQISQIQYDSGLKLWTFYVLPWTMIGIRFTELFNEYTLINLTTFSQLYSLDYAAEYKNFEWIPYVYLLVVYSLPIFSFQNKYKK